MTPFSFQRITYTLVLSLFFIACSKNVEIPSLPLVIAVAPFNQPTDTAHLLAGYLPKQQGTANIESLREFDAIFREKLEKTQHTFIFLKENELPTELIKDSRNRQNPLTTWARLAQKHKADYIIVPQVLEFEELTKDRTDVRSPASLTTDTYFIRATHPETKSTDGFLQDRSHYKIHNPLTPDIFSKSDSISPAQRRSIKEFAKESMTRSIRDFYL